jgi:hypothetical protein
MRPKLTLSCSAEEKKKEGYVCIYIVEKSKEVKTGCNLTESSKEGYGSRRAVFANDDDDDE